jgi:hypothetical protein
LESNPKPIKDKTKLAINSRNKCNKIKFKQNNNHLKEKEFLKRRNKEKRIKPKKLP